jgi:outer membrane immunogenic protein
MKFAVSAAAALSAVALLSTSAFAADIPARAPMVAKAPAAIVVANSWSGCYIGAGGGYGMWNQENTALDNGVAIGPTTTAGGRGWFGTAQVGCDYQISPAFVIGAYGDFDFSDLKGTPGYGLFGQNFYANETQKWSWSAGGRIGYLITPTVLAYFSGGYTQARFDQVNVINAATNLSAGMHIGATTYSGWYLGSGYEYAISFLPGLFWKTEYRFAQYRAKSNPIIDTPSGLQIGLFAVDSEKYVQTIRSQLVWRFGWR